MCEQASRDQQSCARRTTTKPSWYSADTTGNPAKVNRDTSSGQPGKISKPEATYRLAAHKTELLRELDEAWDHTAR
ncbi:hypothetical protein P7K49_014340 [Saguinus oedipus]|uniref:Uncharacterized protein n=1 Tax=Saguinus oedipus TaxID=9490 RepID=A0ABQ9VII5_SAGOE|nr:hypothetical protein P7K49_014340 [Saguinus oedipus]